jgi:glycerol-3-phosphate O-acyltransferase
MRQAPYSLRVWVTTMDGASMIKYAESLKLVGRRPHDLGEIIYMTEDSSVLTSYFRNNILHLLLMPSLLACAFLNNATVTREDLQRLARRVYPYVAEEYFLRWSEQELTAIVDELLEDLLNHGLLNATEGRNVWHRPAAETPEAVQLSVLARASVPIVERYYLALSLLLKAGSGKLSQDALERQCQLMAERMSLLYELRSPEFSSGLSSTCSWASCVPARCFRQMLTASSSTSRRCSRRSQRTRSSCCTSRSATASCRSCIASTAGRALFAHYADA